jgi:hypothetical protein
VSNAPHPDRLPAAPREGADHAPQATLREVVAAVFWGLFGVRKGRNLDRDAARIRPQQVIVVGILMAAVFVGLLILVARVVVRAAG